MARESRRPKKLTRRAKKGEAPHTKKKQSKDFQELNKSSPGPSNSQNPVELVDEEDRESIESDFSDQYDREDVLDPIQEDDEPKWSKRTATLRDPVDGKHDEGDEQALNVLDWEDEDEDDNEDDGDSGDGGHDSDSGDVDDNLIEQAIDEHSKLIVGDEGWRKPDKKSETDQAELDPKKAKMIALMKRIVPTPKVDPETGVQYPSEGLLSQIKNKQKRRQLYEKFKEWKKKQKVKSRMDKKKAAKDQGEEYVKPVPKTIESMREADENWVDDDDQEAHVDIDLDEMSSYFRREYEPKVLITTSDNPHSRTIQFCRELKQTIPNAEFRWRNRSAIKKIVAGARARGYTDLLVIHEDWRRPTGLILCHLPEGPTAYFKLTNARVRKQIKRKTVHSSHRPEVILNQFNTRVGHTVGRMLGCLFHYDPEFRGRRVVTFHNQRDYIFFRHHRYQFTGNGTRVALAEIGPRFSLKLRALQRGTFDPRYGEFEWSLKRHEMQSSRRKFML